MGFHQLNTIQRLPISLEEAWAFFSSPVNLKEITPDYMGFNITSGFSEGDKMYTGKIITYKVKPVASIPLSWMTEITHIEDKKYFIDEQRFGPYSLWHHQHWFKAVEGGVEMKDIINYKLPMGFLGDIANTIFVKKQLEGVFNYRHKKLEQLFGKM